MIKLINGKRTIVENPVFEKDPIFEIQFLKQKLAETDYVACKIAEGSATAEDYADIIAERQKWREKINALESELKQNV